MDKLVIGLLGALLATNQPAAASKAIKRATGIDLPVAAHQDPVEQAYHQLLAEDDAAQAEIDHWIRENQAFAAKGAGLPNAALNAKIHQRLDSVKADYEHFLQLHPRHADARLAYGSFLDDIGEEAAARQQWEKARDLAPNNPAAWNNLAISYGHRGPVKKAFDCYAKAIELNPRQPVYYQNLATTVFLFRKDAKAYYHIDEQQVFDKALKLYEKARKLDPDNLPLATDLAMTYYGIKPKRIQAALDAWRYALKIAKTDFERQGIRLHLARWQLNSGRFDAAHQNLAAVHDPKYQQLKALLKRNLQRKEEEAHAAPAKGTPHSGGTKRSSKPTKQK